MALEVGPTLRGDNAVYKISSPIGEGARGQAFLAVVVEILPDSHARIQRTLTADDPVVVKVPLLADEYRIEEQRMFIGRLREEFSNEYRTFDQLADVTTAAHVYDIGMVKVPIGDFLEPSFFVVYEHIKGERLDKYFDCMAATEGRPGIQNVTVFFDLARKLNEALAEIHRAGVVHGDIWPKNIILRKSVILRENGDRAAGSQIRGEPVYIDFGQALIRREVARAERTEESHAYLPPEREGSVQGDVYALCGTFYYLATGKDPPQSDPDIDVVKNRVVSGLKEYNAALYEQNSGIADIIARGLRGAEGRRTADCGRLLEDIELFDPGEQDPLLGSGPLLAEIGGILPRLQRANPLFARMATRRIRQLKVYLDEMLDQMYDVRGDHNEMVMVFSQFVSAFEPGDQYLTVSVPWFWFRDNLGKRGRFLSVNKQVIKRGASVRRVFLLARSEQEDDDVVEILMAHAEMLDEIDAETVTEPVNTTQKGLEAGGVFTGVKIVEDQQRQKMIQKQVHSGVWLRGARVAYAMPFYSQDSGRLIAVHLRPGDVNARRVRDEFIAGYLKESEEIRSYLGNRGVDWRPT